jgi:hypothetical protein
MKHALPFLPSSPAHRPNSIAVTPQTTEPGGLIIRPYDAKAGDHVTLHVENLLGDARSLALSYQLIAIDGNAVARNKVSTSIASFASTSVTVDIPATLPYGPYLVRYTISEGGVSGSGAGDARIGIAPPRLTTTEEGSRMDYPFAFWMPGYPSEDAGRSAIVGRLAQEAGVGKTWFGSDCIYLAHFVGIKDPTARQAAMDEELKKCHATIAYWRKYGITPLGFFQPVDWAVDPADYPVLADVVKTFVNGLKGDVHIWRHGTEQIHGGVHELDAATVTDAGGHTRPYLFWGRQGTVRQYWAEYEVAFKAAKEADPTCIFGPQAASDTEGSVLHTFFQVLTNRDLDTFGMNTYISAFSVWPPNEKELQRNNVPNLPTYVSEFAAGDYASPTVPDHLEKEHAGARNGVTYWASVLQTFPNFFQLEEWGMVLQNDDGSLTFDGQIRPQYLSFANMTNQLGAGKFIAKYDLPEVEIRVRQRSYRPGYTALVYALSPDHPLDLDAGANPKVFDLWGNSIPVQMADGVLTVQAGLDPIYVVADQEIKPHLGIAITVDPATLDADHPRVTVTLKNEGKTPAPGRLELIQSGPIHIADRVRNVPALAPGQEQSFTFDLRLVGELLDKRLPIKVRYTVGPKIYELPAGLNFNTARKASTPVTIDADPAGWDASEFNMVADRKDQIAGSSERPWGGPSDVSAQTGCRWDEQFLYAFFKVTDDVDLPPKAEGQQWYSDGVELYLDLDRKLTSEAPFIMFSLARYPDGPKILRYDGNLPQGAVPGAKIAAKRVGNQTFYEAAIPWNEIVRGFKPHLGQTISLGWWIDDRDGGSDIGQRRIAWFAGEKDPALFGDLTLVGASGKP